MTWVVCSRKYLTFDVSRNPFRKVQGTSHAEQSRLFRAEARLLEEVAVLSIWAHLEFPLTKQGEDDVKIVQHS